MLIRRLVRVSRLACVCLVALAASSCGSDNAFDPDLPIVGHYVATDFRVVPVGGATVDVLARGGSIVLDITADNKTTGELVVPANIFGVELRQSLSGTVARAGNNLTLSHTPATFLTQLIFGVYEKVLFVGAQSIDGGNAALTITLTRQ
jgi:hypothetical protein